MRPFAPLLLAAVVALAGCSDAPTESREPVAENFRAPVDGGPRTSNVFDHEWPFQFQDANGYLLAWWGERVAGIDGHSGYDFVVPRGTPVRAVTDGVITAAGMETPFHCPLLGATVSGLQVRVAHRLASGRYETASLHLDRVDVGLGQRVIAGQQLGLSGNTGCSTGPHLHFAVRRLSSAGERGPSVDPYGWQANEADPWAAHPQGTASTSLWRAGAAPPLYSEVGASLAPGVPAGIVRVRWMGVRDAMNPSNEFVDVEKSPTTNRVDIGGWTLQTLAGPAWTFPAGTVLDDSRPRVRVYVGAPGDAGSLGMGRTAGVIDNRGDCVALTTPTGARYTVLVRTSSCPQVVSVRAARLPIDEPGDAAGVARSFVVVEP